MHFTAPERDSDCLKISSGIPALSLSLSLYRSIASRNSHLVFARPVTLDWIALSEQICTWGDTCFCEGNELLLGVIP